MRLANPNDRPTRYALEHRLRGLRRETGITSGRAAAGRRAPPNTPARALAAAGATPSSVKTEATGFDAPASATASIASKSSLAKNKATPKTDAKVAAMVIKKEPDAEPTTPTPSSKNAIGTSTSSVKRKHDAMQTDGSMTDSSEEAVSTEADDTTDCPANPSSPKRRRRSHARSSKTPIGALARFDGGDSSDDNETDTGAGAAWAGTMKKRAKRVQHDDSDSDFDPDFDASDDDSRKGQRGSSFRC